IVACTSVAPAASAPAVPARKRAVKNAGDETIRVLVSTTGAPKIASPGGLLLTDRDGALLVRGTGQAVWRIERDGRRVRAVRPDGVGTVWVETPLLAKPMNGALISVGGSPYRGAIALYSNDTAVLVVNVVKIDDYL